MVELNRVIVLVPYLGAILPECEAGLRELERRGCRVWRVGGHAAIDSARCQLASDAVSAGFDWLMWIDSDIGFEPDHVERLLEHRLPVVGGLYAKKGQRQLACELLSGTERIRLGAQGGLLEVRYLATGFLLTASEVYHTLIERFRMPKCNEQFGRPMWPFFLPRVLLQEGGSPWYLGEDYAFCQRLREVGYTIWADTTLRLRHFGQYGYSWEDAGSAKTEYANYDYECYDER